MKSNYDPFFKLMYQCTANYRTHAGTEAEYFLEQRIDDPCQVAEKSFKKLEKEEKDHPKFDSYGVPTVYLVEKLTAVKKPRLLFQLCGYKSTSINESNLTPKKAQESIRSFMKNGK